MAAPALGVGNVVISQVWGGNGVGAGNPNADYVELFNRGTTPQNLTGWSFSVAAPTGTVWSKLDLPAFNLQPGQYFLIQVTTASATGTALPAPDATFSPQATPLSSTTGKVVLRNTTSAIGTVVCITDATVVDLMTYGSSGTCFEGSGRAPAGVTTAPGATPTRSLGGCNDTDNNNIDFANAVPNPRNSSSPTTNCNAASGACCNIANGACVVTAGSASCTGAYQGDNTTCTPTNPCPETRACCSGTTGSTCTLLTAVGCSNISGFWQASGVTCTPSPCTTASCCLPNGTCCNFSASLCASQGGTSGTGTCTAISNCIAAPSNDTCATAAPLSLSVAVIGNNFAATGNDGLNTNCSIIRANKGVWYTFTPATTSTYDISTCGTTFDNILGIWTIPSCADLSTWVAVACDDDGCPTQTTSGSFCGTTGSTLGAYISNVQLTAGVTYHILMAADSTSATGGGNFTLTVSDTGPVTVGACCTTATGVCWITTLNACTTVATPIGIYQGDGTLCSPSPCGGELGACCAGLGVCVLRTAANCTGTLIFQGAGVACGPNPCIVGSCCNNCTFACTITVVENCTTGTWTVDGLCTPNICGLGAAPSNDEPTNPIVITLGIQVSGVNVNATDVNDGPLSTCDTTVSRGMWYSFTPATTAVYQVATCGSTHDTVLTVFAASDVNTALACDADTCVGGITDPIGCGTTSSSTVAARIDFVSLNAGTQYLIRVQSGSTTAFGTFVVVVNPSASSSGACCNNTTGVCTLTLAASCSTTTSTYQGDGTVCTPSPCPPSGSCCNPCTFACTLVVPTNCASGSVWTSGGTCTPNVCGGASPANDAPCGAIPLTLNATVVSNNASASSADDGPLGACSATSTKGVWYSFTPAVTGDYTVTTCGATFDSILSIFTGDCVNPSALAFVACDDDACLGSTRDTVVCGTAAANALAAIITSVNLVQGTTYYLRVTIDSATAIGGTFPITIRSLSTGSCCTAAGACTVVVSELCANVNVYLPGTACFPGDCPISGACCDPCGICTVTFASLCTGASVYQGNNSVCASVTCPGDTITPPANDNCSNAAVISAFPYFASGCNSGATGDGPIGTCQAFGAPPSLLFSVWFKYLATQPGTLSVSVDFITWRGNRLALVFSTPDGSCPISNADQLVCGTTDPYAPTFQVTPGTTYFIAIADEGTIIDDEGGSYTLSVNFAPDAVVCCRGVTCAVIAAADCTAPAGVGVRILPASTTTCAGQSAINAGCCYADFNKSGVKDVADIFAFLSAWFANSPFSDVGGDGTGTRDVSDIFQFLSAWFVGCT